MLILRKSSRLLYTVQLCVQWITRLFIPRLNIIPVFHFDSHLPVHWIVTHTLYITIPILDMHSFPQIWPHTLPSPRKLVFRFTSESVHKLYTIFCVSLSLSEIPLNFGLKKKFSQKKCISFQTEEKWVKHLWKKIGHFCYRYSMFEKFLKNFC